MHKLKLSPRGDLWVNPANVVAISTHCDKSSRVLKGKVAIYLAGQELPFVVKGDPAELALELGGWTRG